MALKVPGDCGFFFGLAALRRGGTGRADLRKGGQIGLLQHEANVRVRDEPAPRIDHIRVPVLADLDLGDDVPDELEVHLGGDDPGVLPASGEGDRHIGLRLLAEVHWAEVRPPGPGLEELRFAGVVCVAPNHVHR